MLLEKGSPHVGPATVFVSHVQASHVASLLGTLHEAPTLFDECTAKTIYWIDFFSLRQGEKDAFVPEQIVDVMKVRRRQRGASARCRPGFALRGSRARTQPPSPINISVSRDVCLSCAACLPAPRYCPLHG